MKKVLILAFLTFVVFDSFGQPRNRSNYFPVWTFHTDSVNIHGISIGLWSGGVENRQTNTNGIKLELVGFGILMPLIPSSPIAKDDSAFFELLNEPISERINGLGLSASGTACLSCVTNGLTAGFIGQTNLAVNGISAALLMNFAQRHNGIMVSMANEAYHMNGLQIGLGNSGYKSNGIQIALLGNWSKEMKGWQIGLINKSEKFGGIQIGLWNVNQRRKLPIINWNFRRDM